MKVLYSFLKDLKLSLQGFYIYIEIVFAFIFVAVMVFVVPENFDAEMKVYASIDLEGMSKALIERGLDKADSDITELSSKAEVMSALEDDRSGVGLVVGTDEEGISLEYILQGYENERIRNILRTSIETQLARNVPTFRDVTTVVTLEPDAEKLSDRLNVLPVFLALNAAFMGLFIIASYIFLDKEEGTIRAFAVTPARVWQYLMGKLGVLLVSGLMSALIATIFVAGAKPHYFHMIVLLLACNAFGSALGLFIASFFDSMTKAMGWLYMTIIVLAFATVSYYMPAFSPVFVRILPSYPMLFAFRETLLDNIDLGYVYANVGGFAAAAVVFFILANERFKKTLTV